MEEEHKLDERLLRVATSGPIAGDKPGGEKYPYSRLAPLAMFPEENERIKNMIAIAKALTPPSQIMMAQSIAREESDNTIIVDVTGDTPLAAANKVITIMQHNPGKHVYPIDVSEGLKDVDSSMLEEFEEHTMALNAAFSVRRGICSIDEIPEKYRSEAAALLKVLEESE